jgi:hypothetical protein
VPLDVRRYVEASRSRCFIWALSDREFGYEHHVILDTLDTIAFLAKYPVVYGHVLVAPRAHREDVVADFSESEYLSLQRVRDRGPGQATNVVVQDVLPAGLSFVSAQATAGTYDAGSGRWTVGTIEVGRPATLRTVARIDAGSRGRIENAARVLGLD